MKQYLGNVFPDSADENLKEKLDNLADQFKKLPINYMKFHGGSNIDEVIETMGYSVQVDKSDHIILDNLQFMMSKMNQKSSFDKYDIQDMALEKFRKFASERNVHIILVVHPRKEDENAKLSISSVFGSAKATQEADNVIIIQTDSNRRKSLDVKKNRHDGDLGSTPIYFQESTGRYVEDEGRTFKGTKNMKPDFEPDHWDNFFEQSNRRS